MIAASSLLMANVSSSTSARVTCPWINRSARLQDSCSSKSTLCLSSRFSVRKRWNYSNYHHFHLYMDALFKNSQLSWKQHCKRDFSRFLTQAQLWELFQQCGTFNQTKQLFPCNLNIYWFWHRPIGASFIKIWTLRTVQSLKSLSKALKTENVPETPPQASQPFAATFHFQYAIVPTPECPSLKWNV